MRAGCINRPSDETAAFFEFRKAGSPHKVISTSPSWRSDCECPGERFGVTAPAASCGERRGRRVCQNGPLSIRIDFRACRKKLDQFAQ